MTERTRQTRTERQAETRTRLLDAATRVFARSGYHGASVDQIAEEAGFSSGALYSNFDGKEDLFLELMERHAERQMERLRSLVADLPSVEERTTSGAGVWLDFIDSEPEFFLLLIEFWAYAMRDAELKPRYAQRAATVRTTITELIANGARELGVRPLLPVEHLAVIVNALADGFAMHRLATPDTVPAELFGQTLALLIGGASAPAED